MISKQDFRHDIISHNIIYHNTDMTPLDITLDYKESLSFMYK